MVLTLGGWQLGWIHFSPLEVRKVELYGRRIKRIRPRDDKRNIKLLAELQCWVCRVVGGPVQLHDAVASPSRAVCIQTADQVSHENPKSLCVCVGLRESNVRYALVIDSTDHADSRLDLLLWDR